MRNAAFAQHLDFIVDQAGEDEASVLSRALQVGLEKLYEDSLITAYLSGKVERESVLRELGADKLEQVDFERDVVAKDVAWGLGRA